MQLHPWERTIHFLRGVHSLATRTLPVFYLFHGANTDGDHAGAIEGYPGVVLKHVLKLSAVDTVSLSCRKAFDHDAKKLTGANFAQNSEETLKRVAAYWSKTSNRSLQDALAALVLLQWIFQDCAKTDTELFKAAAPLGRRIGLLKQHANRAAAHLTLETYEFSILDCAHVVAALTVIGEIIRSFDAPHTQPTYFDTLDEASLIAARQLFPTMPDRRLFQDLPIEAQSRFCWQWGIERGRQMLLEGLPYKISWF